MHPLNSQVCKLHRLRTLKCRSSYCFASLETQMLLEHGSANSLFLSRTEDSVFLSHPSFHFHNALALKLHCNMIILCHLLMPKQPQHILRMIP